MPAGNHSHSPHVFAETEADLRQLYPAPSDISLQKALTQLDVHCRHFISLSPFLCLATSHPSGPADVSPRGDAPGFVRVLDAVTLFIPDRLGNNRLDSLANIVLNPELALLFLVPGLDETLRVNGRGKVVIEGELLAQSAVNGKVPRSGLLVSVRPAGDR